MRRLETGDSEGEGSLTEPGRAKSRRAMSQDACVSFQKYNLYLKKKLQSTNKQGKPGFHKTVKQNRHKGQTV